MLHSVATSLSEPKDEFGGRDLAQLEVLPTTLAVCAEDFRHLVLQVGCRARSSGATQFEEDAAEVTVDQHTE